MNCNNVSPMWEWAFTTFQSLIGILMNCNISDGHILGEKSAVSIPNRDFDELQFEHQLMSDTSLCYLPFQSLIGILMNCNDGVDLEEWDKPHGVSIPNRDFDELQWREPESQAVFSFQGAVARF